MAQLFISISSWMCDVNLWEWEWETHRCLLLDRIPPVVESGSSWAGKLWVGVLCGCISSACGWQRSSQWRVGRWEGTAGRGGPWAARSTVRAPCSHAPLFLCVPFSCSSLHPEISSILQSCSPPKERQAVMSCFLVEDDRQEIHFRIA